MPLGTIPKVLRLIISRPNETPRIGANESCDTNATTADEIVEIAVIGVSAAEEKDDNPPTNEDKPTGTRTNVAGAEELDISPVIPTGMEEAKVQEARKEESSPITVDSAK